MNDASKRDPSMSARALARWSSSSRLSAERARCRTARWGRVRYVEMTIQDSGSGRTKRTTLARIFERSSPPRREEGGTGLGRSWYKRSSTDAGGAIDVPSALGAGSKFIIYLSAREDALVAAGEEAAPQPKRQRRAVGTVLIGETRRNLLAMDRRGASRGSDTNGVVLR